MSKSIDPRDFELNLCRLEKAVDELTKVAYGGESDKDIIVSCTEAARLLGKSTVTVSRMIKEGRLSKTTIGDSTGIRLSEIRKIKAQ